MYQTILSLSLHISPHISTYLNIVWISKSPWVWNSFWELSGQMILEPLIVATYSPSLPCHRPASDDEGFTPAMAWHNGAFGTKVGLWDVMGN